MTIWELGEAAGPLLNAPLSEVVGRAPVMHGCNVFFIIFTLVAATSQSSKLFIAARMLTGIAVAANVLNPAIIGDMFESEKRGSAMSLIMLAPLIGGAIAPAISGAIAQTLGWRQVMYMAAGLAILCEILFLTCFQETYKMAILRRRVKRIQQESGEFEVLKTTSKREGALKIWHSATRPFSVLFGSSVLMLLSLFASIAFSYFYVMCISLPEVLEEEYGFAPAQVGSAFLSMSKSERRLVVTNYSPLSQVSALFWLSFSATSVSTGSMLSSVDLTTRRVSRSIDFLWRCSAAWRFPCLSLRTDG